MTEKETKAETAPAQLGFFADYIEKEIGIVYSPFNFFQLEHRLHDVAARLGLPDIAAVWSRAQNGVDSQLRTLLLDLATNNETSFFRDAAVFRTLVSRIIPDLLRDYPRLERLRIWSAAGSTGQEACSIAMTLDQARAAHPNWPDFQILVTDFSERVLDQARAGRYSRLEIQRGLPDEMREQYFDADGPDYWRFRRSLHERFTFRPLNLLEPFPGRGDCDVIFCRNVLIYQSVENKRSVIEKLRRSLDQGRYLALGAAESLVGISDDFDTIREENAVFYRSKI